MSVSSFMEKRRKEREKARQNLQDISGGAPTPVSLLEDEGAVAGPAPKRAEPQRGPITSAADFMAKRRQATTQTTPSPNKVAPSYSPATEQELRVVPIEKRKPAEPVIPGVQAKAEMGEAPKAKMPIVPSYVDPAALAKQYSPKETTPAPAYAPSYISPDSMGAYAESAAARADTERSKAIENAVKAQISRQKRLEEFKQNPTWLAAAILKGSVLPQELEGFDSIPFAELNDFATRSTIYQDFAPIAQLGMQNPEAGRKALMDYVTKRETTGYDVKRAVKEGLNPARKLGLQDMEVPPQTPAGEAAFFTSEVASEIPLVLGAGKVAQGAAGLVGAAESPVAVGALTGGILTAGREALGAAANPDDFNLGESLKRVAGSAAEYAAYMGVYSKLNPVVDSIIAKRPGLSKALETIPGEIAKGTATGAVAGMTVGTGKAVLNALQGEGVDVRSMVRAMLEESGQEAKEELVEAIALGIVSRLLGYKGPLPQVKAQIDTQAKTTTTETAPQTTQQETTTVQQGTTQTETTTQQPSTSNFARDLAEMGVGIQGAKTETEADGRVRIMPLKAYEWVNNLKGKVKTIAQEYLEAIEDWDGDGAPPLPERLKTDAASLAIANKLRGFMKDATPNTDPRIAQYERGQLVRFAAEADGKLRTGVALVTDVRNRSITIETEDGRTLSMSPDSVRPYADEATENRVEQLRTAVARAETRERAERNGIVRQLTQFRDDHNAGIQHPLYRSVSRLLGPDVAYDMMTTPWAERYRKYPDSLLESLVADLMQARPDSAHALAQSLREQLADAESESVTPSSAEGIRAEQPTSSKEQGTVQQKEPSLQTTQQETTPVKQTDTQTQPTMTPDEIRERAESAFEEFGDKIDEAIAYNTKYIAEDEQALAQEKDPVLRAHMAEELANLKAVFAEFKRIAAERKAQTSTATSQQTVETAQKKPKRLSKKAREARSEMVRKANPGMDEKAILDTVNTTKNLTDEEFSAFVGRMGKTETAQESSTVQSDTTTTTQGKPSTEASTQSQTTSEGTPDTEPVKWGTGTPVVVNGRTGEVTTVEMNEAGKIKGLSVVFDDNGVMEPVHVNDAQLYTEPENSPSLVEGQVTVVKTGIGYNLSRNGVVEDARPRTFENAQRAARRENLRLRSGASAEGQAATVAATQSQTTSESDVPTKGQRVFWTNARTGEKRIGTVASVNEKTGVAFVDVDGQKSGEQAQVKFGDLGTLNEQTTPTAEGKTDSTGTAPAEERSSSVSTPSTEQKGSVKDELRGKVREETGEGIAEERGSVNLGAFTKKKGNEADVAFEDPDKEARWQNGSKGPRPEPILERVKKLWRGMVAKVTREFEYLPRGARFARLRDRLHKLAKGKGISSDEAIRYLQGVTVNMNRGEYNLFRRAVVLADMVEDLDNGLFKEADDGALLAYGFTPETLRKEHARIMEAVERNPEVKRSLEDRRKVMNEIVDRYSKAYEEVNGKPPSFNRENYFRHEVLAYMGLEANRKVTGGTIKLKSPMGRGFLRARKGSPLDFSNAYLEVEHKVMSEMLFDTMKFETLQFVEQNEDISAKLKEEAKKQSTDEKKVNWRDLVPEGYTLWQPREGSNWIKVQSIPARLVDEMVEKGLKELNVPADKIREMFAVGGRRKELVIPKEVAATLDNLGHIKGGAMAEIDGGVKYLVRLWKQWQLLSPTRVAKYNLRNVSGDFDATLAGNPGSLRQTGRAINDLYHYLLKGGEASPELEAWLSRGGLHDVLSAAENVGNVNGLKQFRNLVDKRGLMERMSEGEVTAPLKEAWNKYWNVARMSTDFREAILRYANFLEYRAQLEAGSGKPKNYGASIQEEVDALDNNDDKAYRLSNDLLGAYDEVSVFGQWLRDHMFPFWSWNEVNTKRYYRLIKNAFRNSEGMTTVGRTVGAKLAGTVVRSPVIAYRLGKFVVAAHALSAMLAAWNQLMFPEEEKELPKDVKGRPHIIFGRDKDGKILYFGRLGAISDFYEWMGLNEWFGTGGDPVYIRKFLDGEMSLKEIAGEMVKEPLNKIVQGLGPAKTGFELVLGKSIYPDVTRPRTIRDRYEFLANSFGLGGVYRNLAGKPSRGWGSEAYNLAVYKVDQGEAAYYDALSIKYNWLRKEKGASDTSRYGPRANALYYLKQAIRYGDKQAMERYMLEYAKYGGTRKNMKESIERMHPLSGIAKKDRKAFMESLSERDRELFEKAEEFYNDVLRNDDYKSMPEYRKLPRK